MSANLKFIDYKNENYSTLPKSFIGRDNRNYLTLPKHKLVDLFDCYYKEVRIERDSNGKKQHVNKSEEPNVFQFFINLQKGSPLKGKIPGTDNRIFKNVEDRFYCIDFDIHVKIDTLPYFMKENGLYSLSSSGKLHWYFQCREDLRHILGNKIIIWQDINGKLSDDIDLKDTLYESFEGSFYYANSNKNLYVSHVLIERMIVPTPSKTVVESSDLKIYEDSELWKELLIICKPENKHYDSWHRICFLMKKTQEHEDLFVEFSKGYQFFNEDNCREHFKNSEHLSHGLPALIKTCKSYDLQKTEKLIDGIKSVSQKSYIKMTNYSAAQMFYKLKRDKYIYTTSSGWFIYDETLKNWENLNEPSGLIVEIMETLKPLIKKISEDIIAAEEDDDLKLKLRKSHAKLFEKVESTGFVKSVIEILQDMFLNKEIFEANLLKSEEKTFNLFTGFRAASLKPIISDKHNIFLDHIKFICGDGNEYVLNWIAQLIQEPWKKLGISIVIMGRQGIGKDTIYMFLKKMLGSKYCTSTTRLQEDLFGRFNAQCLRYKFLINIPESRCFDTSSNMHKFKDLITCEQDITEHKNRKQMETPSYTRFFLSSNDSNPIKLDANDRRFCVIESKADMPSVEYFQKLYQSLNDDEVIASLYNYFLTKDISQVNFNERVQSEYLQELKQYSCSPTISFLQHLFEDDWLDSKNRITNQKLFEMFLDYCAKNGIQSQCNQNKLTLDIGRIKSKFGMINDVWKLDSKTVRGFQIDLLQVQSGLLSYGIIV